MKVYKNTEFINKWGSLTLKVSFKAPVLKFKKNYQQQQGQDDSFIHDFKVCKKIYRNN